MAQRAAAALGELFQTLVLTKTPEGPVSVEGRFNEYNLDFYLHYHGQPVCFPEAPPSNEEILEDDSALAGLSGYLVRKRTDQIKIDASDGACSIHLHFEH